MKRSANSEPTTLSKIVKYSSKPNFTKQVSKKEQKPKFGKKITPGKKTPNEFSKGNIKKTNGHSSQNNSFESTVTSKEKSHTRGLKKNNPNAVKTKFGKKTSVKNKFGKMKKITQVSQIPENLLGKDGKPEWNKLKDEKKKLKEIRKVHRTGEDQYQLSIKAKAIWEKLRRRSHTAEKKETLVNDLFILLKGQIPNVVHSHDMARVVQWMLKLGSPSIRTSICEELCANTVMYIRSKYACYCVKRALRYGSKTDRHNLIQSCCGYFLKLIGHTFASPVVEIMYSMFASAEQRKHMHKEIYGEMHALLPPEVCAIKNIPDNMRPAILVSTKTNLMKLLAKKQLLKCSLLQSVLNDFLTSCSDQDRTDILELIQGDILELLSTKEGSRVALLAVWHATNKMKKVIVKALKGKVKEVACSEVGHILLMALFDCIDDTVLVKKALIPELLNEVEELTKNEFGRRVILYLIAHRDPAYFHPCQMETFSRGDAISKRKKDATLRKEEMLEAVSGPLLQKIVEDPVTWFAENSVAMVSLAIMKSGRGESLQAAFEKLASYILDPNSTVEVNNRHFHVIEQSAIHLVFKKLILQDQTDPDRTQETFSMILASRLTEESLNHILQFNRGCFLLILLFESNNKKVCKLLKSKISEPMKAFLQKQETTGSEILLTKLAA